MNHKTRIEKTDSPTVFLHWALFITLVVSLITGLRISSDAKDAVWSRLLDPVLLQGAVIKWHVWAALALTVISIAYVMYLLSAHLSSRVKLDAVRVSQLGAADRASRWRSINIVLYWCAFVLLLTAAITGVSVYFMPGFTPYNATLVIHRVVAWLLIAYVVLHVLAQLGLGGFRQLLKILNPRMAYTSAALGALVVAGAVGATMVVLDRNAVKTLQIKHVTTAPLIDGDMGDVVWAKAKTMQILTTTGQNQDHQETQVSVKLLHDGEYLYGRFEWPDQTRSQKHLPLQKTADGWRVVQSEFGRKDEDRYYEDKFGVMLSYSAEIGGGGSTQLGSKPLDDKPAPSGGRGLHYTTDNSLVDVWHWKSVRTGSSDMNQIDDNFFGPPLEPKSGRYTGGYSKDPKSAGGFSMNWEKYSDDLVIPKRLPKNTYMLDKLGRLNLDPLASDDGQFWMMMEDTVPYSEALDTYPVGTVLPSVLLDGPFVGDRGDVSAFSEWREGQWRMEVRRKLDTGSEFDIPLRNDDKPVYLWVAVFDHSQTRHSRHLHPVQLVLD